MGMTFLICALMKRSRGDGDVAQCRLSSICEALHSTPRETKENRRKKNEKQKTKKERHEEWNGPA